MLKNLFAALAMFAALFASPTFAKSTPPDHVAILLGTLGKFEYNSAPLTVEGQVARVTLSGCDIQWKTGQVFYILLAEGSPPLIIRKDLLDYALSQTNDWDMALEALNDAQVICAISPVN